METLDIAQLAFATLLPALATVCLLAVARRRQVNYWPWQILCGMVFGAIAVFGTEFGVATHDAVMNVRDAAPITAGLLFGGPAGIIAGLIGGIERWFSVLWGRGTFTRVACSLATCASGAYAAVLRYYVFERERPAWQLAGSVGIVAEVLHLLLVFVTNPENTTQAYVVASSCTVPMVCCNGAAVALAVIAANRFEGAKEEDSATPSITQVVRLHLLAVMVAGFALSSLGSRAFQNGLSDAQNRKLLSVALQDAQNDIYRASDDNLLALTRRVANEIPTLADATPETLQRLLNQLNVTEIHVVNEQGIIVASTEEHLLGYDMASGEQSSEFLMLLPGGGAAQLVQNYQPMSYDPNVWRKYAGMRIKDGFVQVAYDTDHFLEDLHGRIDNCVRSRHVGQDGALVVIAPDGSLAATRTGLNPSEDDVAALATAVKGAEERTVFSFDFMGEAYYASYRLVESFTVVAITSVEAAQLENNLAALIMGYMEVLVFAVLFTAFYLLIRNQVVKNVWQVNATLDKITQGDLGAEVNVTGNAEFVSLSQDINTMVASLRQAIAAEAARIDQELDYAREIQESALPRTFPPFPEIDSFDIYALMDAAREVGGDFYDFFLIDDHTLGFLIADVSGKGIPASLFMMAAKIELSNYMSSGMPLEEAVKTANWHLCQGNDAGMFVTVWAATLNYQTGELTYVNAGHNPPLLRHNGTWEWLKTRGGLFLGTFDTAKYRSATLTLEPGDELLLYTDGVNEAFSAAGEQYGDERLEAFLTEHAEMHPHALADTLRADLARWALGAEQSDDITILSLEYGVSPQATGSLTVTATLDQLETVQNFVHEALRGRNCPISVQNQLDIVLEELFVNICNYAYEEADRPGNATIDYVYNTNPNQLTVALTDAGIPFDLLDHADPTKPRSVDEIKIGGLGILMVKRMTDDLSYVRDGDKNVVAFVKSW